MKGILLVDKPSGITSHDVVDRIRQVKTRSVGGFDDVPQKPVVIQSMKVIETR